LILMAQGLDGCMAGSSFGPNCLILHWDGTAWIPSPTPQPTDLRPSAPSQPSTATAPGPSAPGAKTPLSMGT